MALADVESLAIQPNVYYTVKEAAQLLRVSTTSVKRLLAERSLGVKIGRQWRVLGATLLDLSSQESRYSARGDAERRITPPPHQDRYPLHGTPIYYERPTEPVAVDDWEALQ